jgi:hypothetical protein
MDRILCDYCCTSRFADKKEATGPLADLEILAGWWQAVNV